MAGRCLGELESRVWIGQNSVASTFLCFQVHVEEPELKERMKNTNRRVDAYTPIIAIVISPPRSDTAHNSML